MASTNLLVMAPLIVSAILILAVEFKRMLDTNPNTPILNVASVKEWVVKGASVAIQDEGRRLKGDAEVYVGFYLIIALFIGCSNIMSVFAYWQMMRVRYMVSVQTQMAFTRLDQNL